MVIMKNKIPDILHERRLNATDFHGLMVSGGADTKVSWPIALELATKKTIRDTMQIGNIKKAAFALGLSLTDVVVIEAE